MFCPNSADWGNVADWASGVGSLLAVVVALHIALRTRQFETDQRLIELNREHEQHARLRAEAIRLAAEVEANCNLYSGSRGVALYDERSKILETIVGLGSQLRALQSFPTNDARLFGEIGRAAHDCTVIKTGIADLLSEAGPVVSELGRKMGQRREAIVGLT